MFPSKDARRVFPFEGRSDKTKQNESVAKDHPSLILEVERVIFHSPQSRFTVLRAREFGKQRRISAVGSFASVFPGEIYEVSGQWGSHEKFGEQFQIAKACRQDFRKKQALQRYLETLPGIGIQSASTLAEHFTEEQLTGVLQANPKSLLKISGITPKLLARLVSGWCEEGIEVTRGSLLFLLEHGLPLFLAHKTWEVFGNETVSEVKANPYILIKHVRGVGFLTADRMARSLGLPEMGVERLQAGLIYSMEESAKQGHCFLARDQLCAETLKILQLPSEEKVLTSLQQALSQAVKHHQMVITSLEDGSHESNPFCFLRSLDAAESATAASLVELNRRPLRSRVSEARVRRLIEALSKQEGLFLSVEQTQAVCKAITSKVFLLTGGPGVGKTTTAKVIIKIFDELGHSIALAAPTGRAAQKLNEVSKLDAKTIHRLLEWSARERRFLRCKENPLLHPVVLIDEVSMLDISLARDLLDAVPPTSQLILIGDVDQLPSVGPGYVFKDLLDSKIFASQRLTHIFRQAQESQIISFAHKINRGETLVFPEGAQKAEKDCVFFEASSPVEARQILSHLCLEDLPRRGWNPLKDIQVLTPMHRGELGSWALNKEMQELLNPYVSEDTQWKRGEVIFRQKDKVIQTANNYDLGVFNGEIGTLLMTHVDDGKMAVHFGDRTVHYSEKDLEDLMLAYAISIHKSQGSEFPVVIIFVHRQHHLMLRRNLIYTALTRAKKRAIFIGEATALAQAVESQHSLKRQTCLLKRLRLQVEEKP